MAVHQYGAPDVWKPDRDWYGYRLEHQVLRRLPFKKVQFAVTEYGIDGLIQGGEPRGWQGFTDAAGYADQLITSGRYLERFSGRVLGYSVFTLGHNNPWQTYEISGAVAEQAGTRVAAWHVAGGRGTGHRHWDRRDDGMSTDLGEVGQGGGAATPRRRRSGRAQRARHASGQADQTEHRPAIIANFTDRRRGHRGTAHYRVGRRHAPVDQDHRRAAGHDHRRTSST